MPKTIADLINDYSAPEQPEDCREASALALAAALHATGPVVHQGKVFSVTGKGETSKIGARAIRGDAADEEAAEAKGLPLASETPVPEADEKAPRKPAKKAVSTKEGDAPAAP
jgi:hypothetical protein